MRDCEVKAKERKEEAEEDEKRGGANKYSEDREKERKGQLAT